MKFCSYYWPHKVFKSKLISRKLSRQLIYWETMQSRDEIVERLRIWIERALLDVICCWTSSVESHTSSISTLESRLNNLNDHLYCYIRQQLDDSLKDNPGKFSLLDQKHSDWRIFRWSCQNRCVRMESSWNRRQRIHSHPKKERQGHCDSLWKGRRWSMK
jgi:hypothetical protein